MTPFGSLLDLHWISIGSQLDLYWIAIGSPLDPLDLYWVTFCSLLDLYWISIWIPIGSSFGSLLNLHWISIGSLLDIEWISFGSLLDLYSSSHCMQTRITRTWFCQTQELAHASNGPVRKYPQRHLATYYIYITQTEMYRPSAPQCVITVGGKAPVTCGHKDMFKIM